MLILSTILASTLSLALGGSCDTADWTPNYNAHNCNNNNGEYTLTCHNNWNKDECGMRLDGPCCGKGKYSTEMIAVPGSGTNTAFYLYSCGRNNDQNQPWNEVDIEILGSKISNGQTEIWTNLWTKPCDGPHQCTSIFLFSSNFD